MFMRQCKKLTALLLAVVVIPVVELIKFVQRKLAR